ncbi:MAG TPA: AtpZ/AtpI family protein [Thermodesulfovibrionales bacterium]|nr:AtpZ/AtpI family protein [Thermodesulfovibrionales bacterium]
MNNRPDRERKESEEKPLFRQLFTVGMIGIQFALSIFVGFAIGYFLDKLFHTFPWLTIIFLIFGIIAAFRELFSLAGKENGTRKKDR